MGGTQRLSRWILRLDGLFLAVAGVAALIAETLGHFLGIGPLAATLGSPHTIGGFEAHGLAVIIAVVLFHAATLPERRPWHFLGLSVHLLLGTANIVFWSSFVQQDLVEVGLVTTALHVIFVAAHRFCLGMVNGSR